MLLNFTKYADKAAEYAAKHVNVGKPGAHIEIRRTFSAPTGSCSLLMLVGLDGWAYQKAGSAVKELPEPSDHWTTVDTRGLNVRMSMNGPLSLTFDDFAEIIDVVEEAKQRLLETRDWDSEKKIVDTISMT